MYLLAGLAVAAVLSWVGWRLAAGRPACNVLLITLDTVRADRVGCYGCASAQTPAIDSLAAGGVRFSRAFTPVPLTLPAHATILTGLLPPEHGVHLNGVETLPGDVPLLAEMLAARGYRTVAVLGSFVLDKRFGLARGFEVYDDRVPSPRHPGDPYSKENPANVVCDRALAWLGAEDRRPFFAWVHFYDPHAPYEPPESYRGMLPNAYDGEIAFVDTQVQRLLAFLDRRQLRRKTLVSLLAIMARPSASTTSRGTAVCSTTPRCRCLW